MWFLTYTDAGAVNAAMSVPRFPSGQNELLYNSFFQQDHETCYAKTSTNIFFRKDGDFQSIQEVLINVSCVISSIVLIA